MAYVRQAAPALPTTQSPHAGLLTDPGRGGEGFIPLAHVGEGAPALPTTHPHIQGLLQVQAGEVKVLYPLVQDIHQLIRRTSWRAGDP